MISQYIVKVMQTEEKSPHTNTLSNSLGRTLNQTRLIWLNQTSCAMLLISKATNIGRRVCPNQIHLHVATSTFTSGQHVLTGDLSMDIWILQHCKDVLYARASSTEVWHLGIWNLCQLKHATIYWPVKSVTQVVYLQGHKTILCAFIALRPDVGYFPLKCSPDVPPLSHEQFNSYYDCWCLNVFI